MLKKTTILLALLTLVLTACGTAQANQTSSGSQAGLASNGKLNAASELIIGTMKLDGTAQAVTKNQAKQLITLWGVYKQLMNSDTAAQAEIDGLFKQIREAMSSEQLKAITDLKLTQSDMMSYMQAQGNSGANRPTQGNGSATNRNNNSGGGMPPGGMPSGGMPPSDFGGGPQGQASGTQTANSTPRAPSGANRLPPMLIDALIQYLQKIAGTAATPQP